MRLLLDTHVVLWSRSSPNRLAARQRTAIADQRNTVFVSSISVAEIGIKSALGKLKVTEGFADSFEGFGLVELPFTAAHASRLTELPLHHRDPFDRMLICQAIAEDLVFVTADTRCAQYEVRTL
ncbi:MAG: type II toxin-antitoxin system VapC family toxin [Pseudolysinimonas sp.]